MGSRLGRRVVHFANLPIKLIMPSSFTNIKEIALKTIPSASKIEIKRVLESLYGFDVEKVTTLNMDGKKKKRGGLLIAKPDYKKAYVTLKNPLSISPDLYPLRMIEEEKKRINKQSKSSLVEEGETKRHWLEDKESERFKLEKASSDRRGSRAYGGGLRGDRADAAAKFPWSSMRSGSASATSVDVEEHLYGLAKDMGITFVTSSQRPALIPYHSMELRLIDGEGNWELRLIKQ